MDSSKYVNNEYAVELEHVSKIYKLKKKEGEPKGSESFYALRDISLKIPKGDVVGVSRILMRA